MPQLVRVDSVQGQQVTMSPQWREITLIFRQSSGRVNAIDAWRYGPLAVHVSTDGSPTYSVTHVRSKLRVCRIQDAQEAMTKAEWMWKQCPRMWDEDEVRRDAIPKDVVQWCREHQ